MKKPTKRQTLIGIGIGVMVISLGFGINNLIQNRAFAEKEVIQEIEIQGAGSTLVKIEHDSQFFEYEVYKDDESVRPMGVFNKENRTIIQLNTSEPTTFEIRYRPGDNREIDISVLGINESDVNVLEDASSIKISSLDLDKENYTFDITTFGGYGADASTHFKYQVVANDTIANEAKVLVYSKEVEATAIIQGIEIPVDKLEPGTYDFTIIAFGNNGSKHERVIMKDVKID